MMTKLDVTIRKMKMSDLLALEAIDPTFESATYLAIEQAEVEGWPTFRFAERAFETPFVKEMGYRYDVEQLEQTRYRLSQGGSLLLVAEAGEQVVAVLEVEGESWRNTALIWALFVDKAWRGRGLGRMFLERAETWARRRKFRALVLETQTNNVPAIRFYQRHGYEIAGFDTHFYTNEDVERREVGLFMYKELKPSKA
jgi:ribosomal protein S18 acetylase RimI-like enzyme